MLCQFITTETPGLLNCPTCNRQQSSSYGPDRTHRECRTDIPCEDSKPKSSLWQQFKSGAWGDITESILSAAGITKEKWQEIVGGKCGCGERQTWLNKVGAIVTRNRSAADIPAKPQ